MMLKYMKEQWIFVYINYLYRIFNISFLFCQFMFTYLPESDLHQKTKYCATWMRESSLNLLKEIKTQELNIMYVRISMLILGYLNM
jgi:hypothetical protein